MIIGLSVPSKSFILGEYAVLQGEPALLACTGPRFLMQLSAAPEGAIEGVHPQSPAGKWVRENRFHFAHYKGAFNDPHQGAGGLGASTAQFLMSYAWSLNQASPMAKWSQAWDLEQLMTSYIQVAYSGEGLAPSGADLLAQLGGGLAWVNKSPLSVSSLAWPFRHLKMAFLRTGQKVATHKHLAELKLGSISDLGSMVRQLPQILESQDDRAFCELIRDYGRALESRGCLLEDTKVLMDQAEACTGVLASKGCGALGADIFMIVYERDHEAEVKAAWGSRWVSDSDQLSEGLKIEMSMQPRPLHA